MKMQTLLTIATLAIVLVLGIAAKMVIDLNAFQAEMAAMAKERVERGL